MALRDRDVRFWLVMLLSGIVLHTCVRIEILNVQADNFLPRKDLPRPANQKWRGSIVTNEERWRRHCLYKEGEERMHRPLTSEERRDMEETIARYKANNRLHSAVETDGLLQYLLAPIALIASLAVALSKRSRPKRLAARVTMVTSLAGIVMMFYRGYFTSLGW